MKIPVRITEVSRTVVATGFDCFREFPALTGLNRIRGTQWIILVDENTRHHCLPYLFRELPLPESTEIITIAAGEGSKTMENATHIWIELNRIRADRNSILVCLGGGVVTDLGGFSAALYHRGMKVIHIPTSLIAQVDAALGGKTAVNLGYLKNQTGVYYNPAYLFINPVFLQTLPESEIISGIAELVKNLLLGNPEKWKKIRNLSLTSIKSDLLTQQGWNKWAIPAIRYKTKVIKSDFKETGIRKSLNFGHTIGHALESLYLSADRKPLTHGEAVAAGLVCASWLSYKKCGLTLIDLQDITKFIRRLFRPVLFDSASVNEILGFIKSDKKSVNKESRFTLLACPGKPVINIPCTEEEIVESLNFYQSEIRKND